MKKNIIFLMSCFLLIGILYSNGRILKANNYIKISGTNGKSIPAQIFNRNKVKNNENGKDEIIKDIVIFFDGNVYKNSNVLVITPDFKAIGFPEGKSSFFKVSNMFVYQWSNEADIITSITNNNSYFEEPLIEYVTYKNKKIVFNSFGSLKQYGDSIIIEY